MLGSAALKEEWLVELSSWLEIPSVSADPACRDAVVRAGAWVRDFLRAAGGEAELLDWDGQPLVVGEIHASSGADNAPTVLCYGHFDVQPTDPLDLWQSPPFSPAVRDGWLYARGAADDKGQLFMLLKAAQELNAAGELGVNVRFLCDGEEETVGSSAAEFVAQDDRHVNACVIFDSGFHRRGVPVFNVATRGLCYFHLRAVAGQRDLHSGVFGGAAANAAHGLVTALAAVLPRDGRLADELCAGVGPPSERELADWHALQPGAAVLDDVGARPADAAAATEFYRRTWAEPALDVHGLIAGSPTLQNTIIPSVAEANVSLRLAPGQDVAAIAEAFEDMLREAAPAGIAIEVTRLALSPPGLVDPESQAVQVGLDVFERVLGVRPLLVRGGGTLPVFPALAARGIQTILTGFDLPEGNAHAPNERLSLELLQLGVACARELLKGLGELRRQL